MRYLCLRINWLQFYKIMQHFTAKKATFLFTLLQFGFSLAPEYKVLEK